MAEDQSAGKNKVSLVKSAPSYKPSIPTFLDLIGQYYSGKLRLNEMTGRYEWLNIDEDGNGDGKWHPWTDADQAAVAATFQANYGIYNARMLEDAIKIYFDNTRENPLTDIINGLRWDGVHRIEAFLHYVTKCEDNEYTREVSRLIFAGGIHRAYEPGCKFDDMVVLVGNQGKGKSTLCRWLALEDDYFREIKSVTGKESVEALRGCWIGEMSELMAMTKIKEMEAVKAFITSQEDSYRTPYSRYPEVIPRRCIFIGTTNNQQFLTDKTGNRRFYPVMCNLDGYDVFQNEKEVKEYIRQCWAEALVLYKKGKLPPFADRTKIEIIQQAQEEAMEDDWRVGAITDYLEQMKQYEGATVSVIELWHVALNNSDEKKPGRSDSIDISKIMGNIPGWMKCGTVRTAKWGIQRGWRKKKNTYPWEK